jgi:exosortase
MRVAPLLMWLLTGGSVVALFRDVLAKLAHDWASNDNYSHGFFILPLAAYFAWERRQRLLDSVVSPSSWGLVLMPASLALLVAGTLGAELFLTRVSLVAVIASAVLYLRGWASVRILAFPIGFLFLMIPLPAIVFNQIAFPLQLLASRSGELALQLVGIPVLREGNVIHLANATLEVAEACSGIRSLVSLLTLGIVLGYFSDQRLWSRIALAISTVPVAIVSNGARVAGTGIAAHYVGSEAATGFFHTFSGWLVFVIAFAMLLGAQRTIGFIAPPAPLSQAAA